MKFLIHLLILFFLSLTALPASAAAPLLTADAAILMDAKTGESSTKRMQTNANTLPA